MNDLKVDSWYGRTHALRVGIYQERLSLQFHSSSISHNKIADHGLPRKHATSQTEFIRSKVRVRFGSMGIAM